MNRSVTAMVVVLFVLAAFAAVFGAFAQSAAQGAFGAINHLDAMILFLIAAVLFGAAAIVDAVNQLGAAQARAAHEKRGS
jgi:hypothetical protein